MRAGLLAAALLAAPAAADEAADRQAILGRLAAWTAAFNAGDAAGACDLFAPDLVYTVPGVTDGTQADMCGNLDRVLARIGVELSYGLPDVHEIILAGDLAVVRLTWTLTVRTGAQEEVSLEEGLDIFRRQPDGRWSIARFVAFTPE